ncbi:MAG: M23 family metallopeptidase [Pelagimonas sp.]|uniref:M23 family metallopeptidase n=1 Tax=Pelagimonas sp. TaxID=2073170 RepID=UPI003D6A86F8
MRFGLGLAAALALVTDLAQAEDIRLGFPLDCDIGKTCFIEDYVDHDPNPNRQTDYRCGLNSRDAHKGTDFALLTFDAVTKGVDVFSAAPGIVFRTRDNMPDDRLMRDVTPETACGNAVIVKHDNGWVTQYCHLKQGSVAVKPGDLVQTGTALGLVGLSGQTNHPHLHFSVYHDSNLIDPFQPGPLNSCTDETEGLWVNPIVYHRTGILTAGITDHVPDLDSVRTGAARLTSNAPNQPIVLYMHAAHAEHGDVLRLTATGPSGEIFDHSMVLKSPKASQMQAYGRKAPEQGWEMGHYVGEATLSRKGEIIAHRFAHITVK